MPTRSTPTNSRASTYTNASCTPCHILPLTHLCSHVDTPTVLYTHPQIHKNPPPCTSKLVSFMPVHVHMEAQTQINAHSHTEDTWCTYMLPSMYSYAHFHTRTPVLTHHYHAHSLALEPHVLLCTCKSSSCKHLHAHTHEHPNMPLCTLVHAHGHSYHRTVQMHFLT